MKWTMLLLTLIFSYNALAKPLTCDGGDFDQKKAFKITIHTDPSLSPSKFTIYESDENGNIGTLFGEGQLLEWLLPGKNVKTTLTLVTGSTLEFQTVRGQEGFDGSFGLNIDGKDQMLYFICFGSWEE